MTAVKAPSDVVSATIKLGLQDIAIRRKGSQTDVARILGVEHGADGRVSIYLDRLLHRAFETKIGSEADGYVFDLWGPFTSVLYCDTATYTSMVAAGAVGS